MSYPPPFGHPPPPPGYGWYPPPRPGTAIAFVSAGLFLACGLLALVTAILSWDGSSREVEWVVALAGAAFSADVTGNLDFAISVTMTVACTTVTFALLLFARLEVVRWVLAVVGAVVTGYYGYAIVRLLADGGAEFMALVLVAFLLWATATVLVLLPQTGRAMRGYQRRLAGPGGGYGAGHGGGGGGYGPPGGYRPY